MRNSRKVWNCRGTRVFGFVGRITRDKGINELLGAFQNLFSSAPNSILMLVGNFEGEEELEQEKVHWAKQSKNVMFVSSVHDVERYYAALDVLVLPELSRRVWECCYRSRSDGSSCSSIKYSRTH